MASSDALVLQATSQYIRELVKLIPAKFYASVQGDQTSEHWKGKGKKQKQPRSSQASKQKQEKSRKAKLSRLDPTQSLKTAEELKQDAAQVTASAEGDGNVAFSKLEFSSADAGKKQTKKTDHRKLLARAEKRKERLQQLKSSDVDLAAKKESSMAWKRALKKTEGAKLKDDPELLKKTLKRKDTLKKHSRKKWTDRADAQKKRQDDAQEKRQSNIRKRIQDKKETKKAKREKRR